MSSMDCCNIIVDRSLVDIVIIIIMDINFIDCIIGNTIISFIFLFLSKNNEKISKNKYI